MARTAIGIYILMPRDFASDGEMPALALQGLTEREDRDESPLLKWSPMKAINNPTLYPGALLPRSPSSRAQASPSYFPTRQAPSRTGRSLFQAGEGEGEDAT